MHGKTGNDRTSDHELSDDEMEAVVGGLKTPVERAVEKSRFKGEASASIDDDIIMETRIKR